MSTINLYRLTINHGIALTTPMKQSIILRMDMENSKRVEKLRQQYRNILRMFSNVGNYDGYFIGKVSLEFNPAADAGKMSENQAHIIKSRENYAELAASGDFADGYLSIHMYLMKPVSKATAQSNYGVQNKRDVPNKCTPDMIFYKSEILSFVSDTGDSNPIHQGEHPVVPGLLILEKLILDFMHSFVIRFRTPLYADEPVRLVSHKVSGRMDGYRDSDGIELFSCKY